jgi:hypothetical protein
MRISAAIAANIAVLTCIRLVSSAALEPKMAETKNMPHARLSHLAATLGIAALAFFPTASGALAFSATFAWCPEGSPNFQLTDVPQGTTTLQFAMTDLDRPGFHHGGGRVDYRGQPQVPCGALATGFVGPSPPPGEIHTYEFSIKALASNGATLAATTVRRKFPE